MSPKSPYGDELIPLLLEATCRTALQCSIALGIALIAGSIVASFWHGSRGFASLVVGTVTGLLEAMGPILPPLAVILALRINSEWLVAALLGTLTWAPLAVFLKDEADALSRATPIQAAVVLGATRRRVILRHVIPHIASRIGPLIFASFSSYAGLLGALGFLGVSGNARHSLGFMLYDAKSYFRQFPSFFLGALFGLLALVTLPLLARSLFSLVREARATRFGLRYRDEG